MVTTVTRHQTAEPEAAMQTRTKSPADTRITDWPHWIAIALFALAIVVSAANAAIH